MLYHLLYPLKEHFFALNVFKYITFRAMGASVTAFLVCMICGPLVIRFLQHLGAVASTKREHAEAIHKFYQDKKTVPSMGGLLIVIAVVLAVVLWGNFASQYLWMGLIVMVWLGAVGFLDDYVKIRAKNSRGIPARIKLGGQLACGLLLGIVLYVDPQYQNVLYFPFIKDVVLTLGIWLVPFVMLVVVGTSNALNITDGLDGLAIGCSAIVAASFAMISYVCGNAVFASYLNIPYVPQSGELTVLCAALVGACVGFLWYNSYPATVFMGDTGSLAIGGVIGAVSIFIKKELLLPIIGGIFVWEALSVILQVCSFKLRKKRIFLMAPYHHHLQLKGWHEAKVTVRLCIICFVLALIGLSTLKLR